MQTTDDYFQIPRFDRRKTFIVNGAAACVGCGFALGHLTGVSVPPLGLEASVVLAVLGLVNVFLRMVTRKPWRMEAWERQFDLDLRGHLKADEVREFDVQAAREFNERLQNVASPYSDSVQFINPLQERYNEHAKRNQQNADVIRSHLAGFDETGLRLHAYRGLEAEAASELPDDNVVDIANGKA